MTKVCIDCGEEVSGGLFSSVTTCDECGAYLCDDCARETGKDTYCKKCFEER